MKARALTALAFCGGVLIAAAETPIPPPLAAMVQTERDLADTVRKIGMRDAFLRYFADEGLLFVPEPVNGKESLSTRPAEPFAARPLTWETRLGDVASSGELGWLTGPSEMVVPGASQPGPRHLVYLAVWKKPPSEPWRIILDFGVATPSAAPFGSGFQRFAMPDRYARGGGKKGATASLEAADRALNERASKSAADAFAPVLLDSSRFHRGGILPIVGRAAIVEWLRAHSARFSGSTTKAEAAEAGDLGYTYGSYQPGGEKSKTGSYVRMWERRADGAWLVALEFE